MKQTITLFFLFALLSQSLFAQKTGLVLSGGGASGMAHIGVLKALEENNIRIDYIVGTSVGAFIGGMYAAGYSPEEIETLVTSDKFRAAANGDINQKHDFFFKKPPSKAGMVNLNFRLDSLFNENLPTNFVNSTPIDFGLLSFLSQANAVAKEDFDSLLIPFRCLSANITQGKEEILSSGSLSTAIRASMTYPFYLAPISINGNLMFDGGLYNNLPTDIMCSEFKPDFIIASNVSTKIAPPQANNLLSQLRSILVKKSDFKIDCSKGIIINSDVEDISTFDFYQNKEAIKRGYESTMLLIDSIKKEVPNEKKEIDIKQQRAKFNKEKPPLKYENVKFQDLHKNQAKYFKQSLFKDGSFTYTELEHQSLKLASDEKINSIHPTAKWNDSTKLFDVLLKINKEKPFQLTFGGVISSKPFSTGFVELAYQNLAATAIRASGNIYFGTFYSSAEGNVRWDIPFDIPFYIESQLTNNHYDYFDEKATFIDNEDQSYIVNTEQYWESKIGLPVFTKGVINLGGSYFWQKYNYYQTTHFDRGDTSDLTRFKGYSTFAKYSRNSLNRKMYATKGGLFSIMLRYLNGREKTFPGSTASDRKKVSQEHNWVMLKGKFENYFLEKNNFRLGVSAEAVYSTLPLFQNYTATILSAPAYEPLPESKTVFQDKYRAISYAGGGLKFIYTIREKLDFRAEGYVFQPFSSINSDPNGQATLNNGVQDQKFIGTFTTVYQTPVGPLAASVNYYNKASSEFSFLVHFGYILFNKKAFQ